MKKTALLFIFSVAFALSSCGPDKNSPEYITEQYLLALKAKDWDKAKSYSGQGNIDNLDCLIRIKQDPNIGEIKDIECEESERTCTCHYCCVDYSPNGKGQVNFYKEGEEWKVDGVKETCPDQEEMIEPAENDSL